MSILAPPPSFAMFTAFRRFTVDEYHRMIESGILNGEDEVELLEGYVVEKMPRNPPHDVVIQRLNKRLTRLNLAGWEVRVQSAVTLPDSEPEPDVTLARGDDHTFANRHPFPAELGALIEVADSTLTRDRQDKSRIYARANVAIYWIVNLVESQIEVYTDPSGTNSAASYVSRIDYRAGDSVPLILDGTEIARIAVYEIMNGIEDFDVIVPEILPLALERGIDLKPICGKSGLLKDGRYLTFDRKDGTISYMLQGGVKELPKAYAKSAGSFHGAYSESGDCANHEEAVDLVVAWLFNRSDADHLPKRLINSSGIG